MIRCIFFQTLSRGCRRHSRTQSEHLLCRSYLKQLTFWQRYSFHSSSSSCLCTPLSSNLEIVKQNISHWHNSRYSQRGEFLRYRNQNGFYQNFLGYSSMAFNSSSIRNFHSFRRLSFETNSNSSESATFSSSTICKRMVSVLLFCTGVLLGGGVKLAYDLGNLSETREDDFYSVNDSFINDDIFTQENQFFSPLSVSAAEGYNNPDVEDKVNKNVKNYMSYFSSGGKEFKKDPPRHRSSMNFIADVVERVAPCVVFIELVHPTRRDRNGQSLRFNHGSGFVVDPDGLILTNAHVVTSGPSASRVMVRFQDGEEREGFIEMVDVNSDLALVRVNASDLPTAELGVSSELRPGEWVVAVGSPLTLSNSVTAGVVSSTSRCAKDLGIRANEIQYIQTDAAITFGNSGGPLANLDGEVIGINSMKAAEGISFAIPMDTAKEFLAQAAAKRRQRVTEKSSPPASPKRRCYIGITMLSLTPDIISELQSKVSSPLPSDLTQGVMVWRVAIGSPAFHAGLQPGDVITQINGHMIASARDVYRLLEKRHDLIMVVHRGNDRYTVTITPEE